MMGLAGWALQAFARPVPHAAILQILGNGQSLSVGTGAVSVDTTQPYQNVKLFDPSGVYDITNPTDPALTLVPLTAPQRPVDAGNNPYPTNVAGESVEVPMSNALIALFIRAGWAGYRIAATCSGQGGAQMSQINEGGTGNAYAAGQYESQVFKRLSGGSFVVLAVPFTHGETDATLQNTSYEAELVTLAANYVASAQALTGQTQGVPFIASQQNSEPLPFDGENITALDVWNAANGNPGLIFNSGPKYQYSYLVDRVHLHSYSELGELYAWVLFNVLAGRGWTPLQPSGVVLAGSVVTLSLDVPVEPLVVDGVQTGPHLAGPWAPYWALGNGVEVYDLPTTVVGATNASPIVVETSAPHGLTSGDPYALEAVLGNTACNAVWPSVTVLTSTTFELDGSTGSGAYTGGGQGFRPLAITSFAVDGSDVVVDLAHAPATGAEVAYAHHADLAFGSASGTGGFSDGRCGLLRDSQDLSAAYADYAPWSGYPNPNWLIEFALPLT
jgi:hypothetical protein